MNTYKGIQRLTVLSQFEIELRVFAISDTAFDSVGQIAGDRKFISPLRYIR